MNDEIVKQLYERVNDEYKPFLPKIDLQAILESVTARSIAFIFHHYNHFNAEWTDTAENTRAQVPPQLRRNGLWLSYNRDLHTKVTERYKGSDLDAADQVKWVDSEYWEELDFELLLKAAEEAITNIFLNINKYPDLLALIRKIIRDFLAEFLDEDFIRGIIEELLGDIYDILVQFFNSDEGKELLREIIEDIIRDILDDILGDLLDEYFSDIQQSLIDMERVIANALARHEQAIIELQNQLESE